MRDYRPSATRKTRICKLSLYIIVHGATVAVTYIVEGRGRELGSKQAHQLNHLLPVLVVSNLNGLRLQMRMVSFLPDEKDLLAPDPPGVFLGNSCFLKFAERTQVALWYTQ